MEKMKRYRAVCWCSNGGLSTERVKRLAKELGTEDATLEEIVWPPTAVRPHPDLGCDIPFLTLGGFGIEQLTPIRVLHRRALVARKRNISWVRLSDFASSVLADKVPYVVSGTV